MVDLILETLEEKLVDRPPSRSGGRRLVDNPAVTPEERARRLAVYQSGLKVFYRYCERAGALPILFVPAGNDGGFEPNRSVLRASTTLAEREAFARAFQEARSMEETDPVKSMARYRVLQAEQPGFSEIHFRLGRLLEQSGDYDEANSHYRLARDLDGYPLRCPGDFRDACGAEASRHDGILIDAEEILRTHSPHGILNEHLFVDAFHPNLVGYIALARETLRQLHARKAFGWPAGTPVPSFGPTQVATGLGLDSKKWVDVCQFVSHWYDSVSLIRFDSSDRIALKEKYANAVRAITEGVPPERVNCPGIGIDPSAP